MWGKKGKLTELPMGIIYSKDTKELDLTSANIDVIPRKLGGVNIIKVNQMPKYVSPDFGGDIYVSKGSGSYEKVIPIQIYKAKFTYVQNPDIMESLCYGSNSSLEVIALPERMHFYEKDGLVFLDLSKTSIKETPDICGVDQIIMPRRGFCLRKSQMVHSNTKIYE